MVSQAKLVKDLGVTARDLQKRREALLEGFHYSPSGRTYDWTDHGVDQVMFDMGLVPTPPSHAAEVHGRIPKNQRLVGAKIEGTDQFVKVRDNSMYSKNFVFPVRWDGRGFYAVRHPRFKGKL